MPTQGRTTVRWVDGNRQHNRQEVSCSARGASQVVVIGVVLAGSSRYTAQLHRSTVLSKVAPLLAGLPHVASEVAVSLVGVARFQSKSNQHPWSEQEFLAVSTPPSGVWCAPTTAGHLMPRASCGTCPQQSTAAGPSGPCWVHTMWRSGAALCGCSTATGPCRQTSAHPSQQHQNWTTHSGGQVRGGVGGAGFGCNPLHHLCCWQCCQGASCTWCSQLCVGHASIKTGGDRSVQDSCLPRMSLTCMSAAALPAFLQCMVRLSLSVATGVCLRTPSTWHTFTTCTQTASETGEGKQAVAMPYVRYFLYSVFVISIVFTVRLTCSGFLIC
jgi:hypothetical protein